VPGAPGLSFADSASRVVAFILDSVLVAIIASIIAGLLGFGTTTSSATGANFQVQGAAFAIPSAIVGLVYFVFFWTGGRRATPGQMLFKLQVGNAFDGQALTPTQAVKRWFAFGSWLGVLAVVPALYSLGSLAQLVWSIVLLVSTVRSPTKQGLHDKFANSAVVRPSGQSNGVASACLVIGVVVLLLLVFSVVALIFLGSQVSNILSTVGDSI
jgi:uncharacterized RDD family membrane protein YckC